MDLVNEQDIPGAQVGEDRRQIAGTFNRWSGGNFDVHAHLVGHQMGQGGLAQSGWAVKQHVVERFLALSGCSDQDSQIFLHLLLSDQVGERLRPQGLVHVVVWFLFRVKDPFDGVGHIYRLYSLAREWLLS